MSSGRRSATASRSLPNTNLRTLSSIRISSASIDRPDASSSKSRSSRADRSNRRAASYRQVTDALQERLDVHREDVVINLVPVSAEDWSFGNGEASLVKEPS
ncbi:tautomerase family protein [Methylobacterium sp. J-072]|uniref:tautomerase family protein n=1 Tax=Methylobacterium sp. J-072 TaxID=2836651 RepID=UPI00391D334F